MQRATPPVSAARVPQQRAVRAGVRDMAAQRTVERPDRGVRRRGWLRRLLAGLGDSCALAAAALLTCAAVVAVGTVGSLLWMLLLER